MMDLSLRKEQFSHAYVHAIASVAGFGVSVPRVDNDSIDLELSGRSVNGLPLRPRIEVQLKCTSNQILRGDQVVYPLKRKNYDELRITSILVPRLLVVVLVPESEEEWLRHSEEELAMRRCGYWVSLAGWTDTPNTSTVSISIPRANRFDVTGLRALMTRAGHREAL